MSNAKLAQLGIPIDTLASTIQAETAVTPSGMAESDSTNTYLRLTGSPDTLANISNIPIQANDRTFRLGDIAEIKRGYAEPAEPKMYFNGQPAVGIAISMEDGGNNIKLGANLDQAVRQIQQELPLGFELGQVANQPQVVKTPSVNLPTACLKPSLSCWQSVCSVWDGAAAMSFRSAYHWYF